MIRKEEFLLPLWDTHDTTCDVQTTSTKTTRNEPIKLARWLDLLTVVTHAKPVGYTFQMISHLSIVIGLPSQLAGMRALQVSLTMDWLAIVRIDCVAKCLFMW